MIYTICNSLISSLIFVCILYNLNLMKLISKDLIILGIINFSTTLIGFLVNATLGMPLFIILSFLYIFLEKRKIIINIISILITMILFSTIDIMCGYLFLSIFNISIKELLENKNLYSILHLTVLILSFSVSKIIGIFIKKINISEHLEKSNIKLSILVLTNIITTGIVMYILTMINRFGNISRFVVILNIFLFIIYFMSTIKITIFYSNYVKKDILFKRREEEFKQLKEYTGMLEHMHNEMSKFKHDYINIISTIKAYIDEKNINELEKFFNENIIPLSKNINSKNTKLALLQHIKVTGLKGLISSKVVQAQSKEVDVFIDVAEDIERMDMEIIDLCRITGILLDNAIEATINCNEPSLKLGIINRKSSVVMVIINSCEINSPPIYKMFEKGFSTKGSNRGLGLSNVKKIIDETYTNVSLNTSMEKQLFKQELIIKFKDTYFSTYESISKYNYNS